MNDIDLAELLCARLCHDLVSPVGAIGNGLELVLSEPGSSTEDMRLIDESARAAQAALTYFRLAFGQRGDWSTRIGASQLSGIVKGYFGQGRLAVSLPQGGTDLPRPVAKLLLVLLLCGASAAPLGGEIVVATPSLSPLALIIAVRGRRAGLSPQALALATGRDPGLPEAPRDAHFALLPRLAACFRAEVMIEQDTDHLTIRVAARP